MLAFKHILVPVDFTETSDRAIDTAIDLAQKYGAKVTVMHAYQIPVYGFPDGAFITGAEVAAQLSTSAQEQLDALVAARKDCGVPIAAVLRNGVPGDEINAVVAEQGADLVLIGTHARRGLARALLGSVAERVIRTVPVPVLVIHGPREG